MNKRTKITKNSLESIGFEKFSLNYMKYTVQYDELSVFVNINDNVLSIETRDNSTDLDRDFEYIDEITTLLEGLTGKKTVL